MKNPMRAPTMLLVLLMSSIALAQSPPPIMVPGPPPGPTAVAKPDGEAEKKEEPKKDDKKAEEEKKKKARLDKIKKVKFDRRVASLLKAWAKPEGEEEDKEKEKDKDQDNKKEVVETDPLDDQIKKWEEDVALSQWDGVAEFFGRLEEDEAKAAYETMLRSLASTTPAVIPDLDPALMEYVNRARMDRKEPEPNFFTVDDVAGLINVAPMKELDEASIITLGTILRTSLSRGTLIEDVCVQFREDAGEDKRFTEREAAKVLAAAGQARYMGEFLPELEEAIEKEDHEALNLLSAHYQAVFNVEREKEYLTKSWDAIQAVLSAEGVEKKQRERALKAAVNLAPRLDEEVGEKWLEETFRERIERGREVIEMIGSSPPGRLETSPTNTASRFKALELQAAAVEALLRVAPERAKEWSEIVNMLGHNWFREAEFTQRYERRQNGGYGMQRDRYGNYYYAEPDAPEYVPNQVRPIASSRILELIPSEEWLALIDKRALPNFQKVIAQLHLKAGDDEASFPYIEILANEHPEMGKGLVEEYLRVWKTNHDPNENRNRTSPYMYYYGYEQKAEGIPLTRSKQERNIEELAEVAGKLRSFPIEKFDESLLVSAFTTCHSSAEVYRLEAIEKVFGSLDSLKAATLAGLAQKMRSNLATVWRDPESQKKAKTNRKQKDIQVEVTKGYEVLRSFVDSALEKHPDSWELYLAKAATAHDENNFRQKLDPDSEYTADRHDAFSGFRKAAEMYVNSAGGREQKDESNQAFDLWFYASLGACQLGMIEDDMVPDRKQPERIRELMNALPKEQRDRHIKLFASYLFSRMSSVSPAVKFNYLRSGFEIVKDHEAAKKARDLYDYYNDLVTEIELETVVDGTDVVGHESQFGLFVNIRHTREIERESGGFSRYLQNQNQGGYYYNYGRPLENYREKFEEIVVGSLGENFDVQSVTFQKESVNSRAVEPYGWRVTPYAYVLLKAKGPEIDQIPSLRLDLDFLDTSGYAVLPIESPVLPVNASPERGDARPLSKLNIVQTLDERQANEGKLILEVKATGRGLIPELDDVVDLNLEDFDVEGVEDRGLLVAQFDEDSEESVVLTERSWLVDLKAKENLEAKPDSFSFASSQIEGAEMSYQRYEDADLAAVENVISLEEEYGSPGRRGLLWGLFAVAALAIAFLIWKKSRRVEEKAEDLRFPVPDSLTPFSVIGYLDGIRRNNGLTQSEKSELEETVLTLEKRYFGNGKPSEDDESADLDRIAKRWAEVTNSRS